MKADWSLAGAFLSAHPKDAAPVLEQAGPVAGAEVLSRFPARVVADALRQLDPGGAAAILVRLPAELTARVLSELPLRAATLILRPLDREERERVLSGVPEETVRSVRTALFHPAGTAGAMMDSNVLALPSEIGAGDARKRLRRRKGQTGNYVYVVDADRKPVGAIGLGALMVAPPKDSLALLMRSSIVSVPARADVKTILAHPGWRQLHALPVVDGEGVLVGVLRRETLESLREEAAEQEGVEGRGFGLALAEMFWTLAASAADELAQAARKDARDED